MLRLFVFALAATIVAADVDRFDNYKVFAVTPTVTKHLELLRDLSDVHDGFDFWSSPARLGADVHVMVSPHRFAEFEEYMGAIGVNYTTYIENVQSLIDAEGTQVASRSSEYDFVSYKTLDAIYEWLDSLAVTYPDIVEVVVGGETFEGREIKGIKISYRAGSPGIFIEGGIHSREWISPATVTYIINELLTSNDADVRELAESHDWYIFPVFNPDGYVFTHTSNRMWRKTRSRSNLFCRGTDPNRNWPYMWMMGGASSNGCLDTFAGTEPLSEIETRTMARYIDSVSDKFYAYLSFHSFTQLLLLPYGHTTEHLDNYDLAYDIGTIAMNALAERYGTKYTVGNIAETIYIATGGSIDWVKNTYQTPLTYCYELRDLGRYGFILPPQQIIPTGEETMDSLVAMFKAARRRGLES